MELEIARLELEPGDVLVVRSDHQPRHEMIMNLIPPGVRVLYIPKDMDLSVLTKIEIDGRAK